MVPITYFGFLALRKMIEILAKGEVFIESVDKSPDLPKRTGKRATLECSNLTSDSLQKIKSKLSEETTESLTEVTLTTLNTVDSKVTTFTDASKAPGS